MGGGYGGDGWSQMMHNIESPIENTDSHKNEGGSLC
jgi:hypothetical protein